MSSKLQPAALWKNRGSVYMIKTVLINVRGTVTGVGFRFAALREARRHPEVRGYVRNASSREVEAVLQGPAGAVDELTRWFRHGPGGARVLECQVTELANEHRHYSDFSIAY